MRKCTRETHRRKSAAGKAVEFPPSHVKTKARLTVNSFFSDLRRQLIMAASLSSGGRAGRVTPFR